MLALHNDAAVSVDGAHPMERHVTQTQVIRRDREFADVDTIANGTHAERPDRQLCSRYRASSNLFFM